MKGSLRFLLGGLLIVFLTVFMTACGGGGGGGGETGGGDTLAPSTPTYLTATAASGSQIDLSWTASTDNIGVTGYKIYRGGTYLKSVTTTSASDTGLNPSTQYCYTVSAYDAAGNESAQSSQACATTSAQVGGNSISGNLTDTCSYGQPYLLVNGTMTFGGSPCGLSSINISGMLMMNGEFDFAADQAPFIVGLRSYNFNSTSMSGLLTVYNTYTYCTIINATFSMNKTGGTDSCGGLTGSWSGSWNSSP